MLFFYKYFFCSKCWQSILQSKLRKMCSGNDCTLQVCFLVSDPLCLSSYLALHFFRLFLCGSTTLLTGMTGISLYMQWPLTSQSHGSVSQREQLVFHYGSNSMPLQVCLQKSDFRFAPTKLPRTNAIYLRVAWRRARRFCWFV
jgi:hypothetical protein